MNRTAIAAATAATAVLLASCSATTSTAPKNPTGSQAEQQAPSQTADASSTFTAINGVVPKAKLGTTVTAENDPNHLLGRPGQYTSKITFTDSRINGSDVDGLEPDDVQRGGSIETFATPAEAKARADYIQAATQTIPALAEYDYLHGPTLLRVSHYLTPGQAGEYKQAIEKR
ncbi:hypothetical protein OS965_02290 [Streptomyces sp. H27-G5]|uniref:hypothetical protein n=1 Tax=Streptomyces sp. H27-G5 TaxID=2996698 RepID=UPI002271AD99|nr:hypothetical protein [Streptomyces sp. H27-G5]MCY0917005.1 hypothetical protein [Streptomyces sp. H27-G5]